MDCREFSRSAAPLLVGVGLAVTTVVAASDPIASGTLPLRLAEAEAIALRDDPAVAGLRAHQRALDERAVAAAQLPDPKLKLGSAALPLDTFDLDQEPMTQLQLGIQQRFPPSQTRAARRRMLEAHSDAFALRADDQRALRRRQVRLIFLEAVFQARSRQILERTEDSLTELAELTTDYYAAGRVGQQDVYRADLERLRLQERIADSRQRSAELDADLAALLGQRLDRPLAPDWPELPDPPSSQTLIETVETHPSLGVLSARIGAASAGADLARSQTRPGWAMDITYGERQGSNPDGSRRADFLSAMVTVDLPLFTGQRQDRQLAASLSEMTAIEFERDDARRALVGEVSRRWASLRSIRERLALFQTQLLPQAAAHREAALLGYQSGASDVTALMRAQITEYELMLERARLMTDERIAQARLWYLAGAAQ